jgi:TolA-binding protein
LFLCTCAAEDPALRQELASLRAEVRTLQQGNAELSRKVDGLVERVDVLAARPPPPAPPAAVAPAAAAPAPLAEPLVPPRLKVVRVGPDKPAAKGSKPPRKQSHTAAAASRGTPPPVPTSTPIREPDPAALSAMGGGGKNLAAEAQAALDAAEALSGLSRSRALEQFATRYPGHRGAQGALVGAARARADAGDPDGSCEDLARAVKEYPAGNAMPDALVGLASCERRAGRADEATRLEARLAQDYPNSLASRRAPERAAAAQGAAP